MKRQTATTAAALFAAAFAANASGAQISGNLQVSADRMAADRATGSLVATGSVKAALGPVRMYSSKVERDGDDWIFADDTRVTTCTNSHDALHWACRGGVRYHGAEGEREFFLRNAWLEMWNMPVAWLPMWWQPLDTDYGWRVMPGYRSRWGGYLLTKYVYTLAGKIREGQWGLGGNTRFDVRTKNGVALGQGVRWSLGDFGKGSFKAYYAWDEDADRYDRRWSSKSKRHYGNWGSTVPDERYGLAIRHRWESGERDVVRARAAYYSDSYFKGDFLRDLRFGPGNVYPSADRNELAWEHLENAFGAGVSVSGPVNEFYGGTARLPEAFIDVMPQSVFGLPFNYESSARLGWLDRQYAKIGRKSTPVPYRYDPGRWADYQAARFDTYHRLTLPFKLFDVLSVVPRAGVRGTWWSDTGRTNIDGYGKAGALDDDAWRTIVEGGATISARLTAPLTDVMTYILEPYSDVTVQEARYHGMRRGARTFLFDAIDGSSDWLDQFAGRGREVPYSWRGVTPGLRNVLRRAGADGVQRTVLDFDIYAAVQLNDTSWTDGGRWHRLSRKQTHPNYGRDGEATVNPGARAAWHLSDDSSLRARAEWDGENDTLAYASAAFSQRISRNLSGTLSFAGRDQRWWDFSSTPYDAAVERNEDFNRVRFAYAGAGLEYELCDAVAVGPYLRWDVRENELDEAGAWLDLRTDCLGFRLSVSYENDYRRIDGSEHGDDWRVGFSVYLRAFGPGAAASFGE